MYIFNVSSMIAFRDRNMNTKTMKYKFIIMPSLVFALVKRH